MRRTIVVAAVAATIFACGGSTTTTSDDGGAIILTSSSGGSSSSSSSSSGGVSSSSSSGGGVTGSCPQLGGTYQITWTLLSGGGQCALVQPSNGTTTIDSSTGIPGPSADAGISCPMTIVGCFYSASCNINEGDAGSVMIAENFNVASSGNISGMLTFSESFSAGGQTTSLTCTFSMTGTKM